MGVGADGIWGAAVGGTGGLGAPVDGGLEALDVLGGIPGAD